MSKDQFKTGDSPFIRVERCGGDLVVRGWAETVLQVKGDYQLSESEKGYSLSSEAGLHIYIPRDATLSVGRVGGSLNVKQFTGTGSYDYIHGDAVISQANDNHFGVVHGDLVARNLIGALIVDEINGDMVARGISHATIKALHGDLSARIIDGNISIDSIHGDADLRTVNGDVVVNQGFRDVNLNGVSGRVAVSAVTGDIRLRGGLNGGDHVLESRGDIVIRWPEGLPINMNASGSRIDNRLELEDATTEKQGTLTGRIGQSDTNLTVKTMGRVILRQQTMDDEKMKGYGGDMEFNFEAEMAGITARIEAEVNNHIARVTRDIESKFGPDFGQRINEKIAHKMDKVAERSRRRTDPRSRTPGSEFGPQPAAPSKKSASTEEQLKILKMVETGKISPEEAGMLLEALEA